MENSKIPKLPECFQSAVNCIERVLAQAGHPFYFSDETQHLAVGFSGGRDSLLLLWLAAHWRAAKPGRALLALHVNHGLSSAANSWAAHCQVVCAQLAVPLQILPVRVVREPGTSLEDAARKARYQALLGALQAAQISVLSTAHHQQDQAETFLFQALRGAGVAGLGAMQAAQTCAHWQGPVGQGADDQSSQIWQIRPLLDFSEHELAQLASAAQAAGLAWIEDESNRNPVYLRNFLRLEILPRLAGPVPQVSRTLARSAQHSREAANLAKELAEQDLSHLIVRHPERRMQIDITALQGLTTLRQRNLLRYWLQVVLGSAPSSERFEVFFERIAAFLKHGQPLPMRMQFAAGEICYYRQYIWGGQKRPPLTITAPYKVEAVWDRSSDEISGKIQTPVGDWEILPVLSSSCAPGVPACLLNDFLWMTPRSRPGSQRIKLQINRPAKTFKQWCQELGLDPVQRSQALWLYAGSDAEQKYLLAINSLGMTLNHATSEGERYTLLWRG